MRKYTVRIGDRFGRWTVIADGGVHRRNRHMVCRCDCGAERLVAVPQLGGGRSQSCGCLIHEKHRKHGASATALYKRWMAMIQRCENPNNTRYADYGGRGIRVCDPWRTSFAAFYEDMGEPPAGMTLDRIDQDGDYAPGNCRWATGSEQQNNMRNNVVLTAFGETRTLSEWAVIVGLFPETIWCRVRRYGWSVERALREPAGSWNRERVRPVGSATRA